jgi:hypothetical protein
MRRIFSLCFCIAVSILGAAGAPIQTEPQDAGLNLGRDSSDKRSRTYRRSYPK